MKFASNRLLYIRRALFAVLLIIAVVLQNTRGAVPAISSVHAMLPIPLVVAIAMHEKSVPALLFGTFAGVMLDMFSISTDGFFAVLLAVTGFTCSLLVTFEMRNNIVSAVLLCGFSTFIYSVFYWLFFFLIKGYDMAFYVYFRYYFTSALYSTVYIFIFYFLVGRICKWTTPERKRINY